MSTGLCNVVEVVSMSANPLVRMVAATTWGPSGLLGLFVMTAGPNGAAMSLVFYLIGLAISYVMGFVITWFGIKDEAVAEA